MSWLERDMTEAAKLSGRNTSGLRGVWWDGQKRLWRACIEVRGRTFHLGCWLTPVEVACAYDNAAERYLGDRARVNFPRDERPAETEPIRHPGNIDPATGRTIRERRRVADAHG